MGDETEAILRAGGLKFRRTSRVDFAPTNIPGLFIWDKKNGDLAEAVAREEAVLAILGQDKLEEYGGLNFPVILKELGFSRCVLKIGVTSRNEFGEDSTREYQKPEDLIGKTIVTSYPRGTARWLDKNNIPWVITNGIEVPDNVARIIKVDGGEESRVNWGSAQACVMISDTGNSLMANEVGPIDDVLESQAVLVANPNLRNIRGSEAIIWRALRIVMTELWQTQYTLLKFNYPELAETQIMEQTPARESPTKMPLDAIGWKAAETLIPIRSQAEVETNLLELGARDLVYTTVERMVPNLDDPEVTRMMRAIYGETWQFSNILIKGES